MSLNKADKNSIAFYYYNKNDKSTLTDGNYQIVGIKDTTLKADLYSYLQEEHMVKLHEYAHLFHEDVNLDQMLESGNLKIIKFEELRMENHEI